MKVFLTGGTGLVGRHVLSRLISGGYEVTALARSQAAERELREQGATPLRGDLREHEVLRRAAAAHEVTVHAAATILHRGDWSTYYELNVAPVEQIARAAAAAGARMVHISSVAVYGRRRTYDGGPRSVSEEFGLDHPLFPGDHYARSKREAELAVWRAVEDSGLRAVAIRPCVLYGEGDRTFSPRVARALRYGVAPLVGEGRNALSVVYAGNVAGAVVAAVERTAATGPFNVANDGALTQQEFVERFAAGLGVRVRLIRVPLPLARAVGDGVDSLLRVVRPRQPLTLLKNAVHFLSAENPYVSERAARELGWRPSVEPGEAVRRTAEWFVQRIRQA